MDRETTAIVMLEERQHHVLERPRAEPRRHVADGQPPLRVARAAALAPGRADIRNAQGVVAFNLADHDTALCHYREALALEPVSRDVHSNLLMALHHVSPVDPAAIAEAHADAVATMPAASPAAAARDGPPDPERRLAVAYVSPRF